MTYLSINGTFAHKWHICPKMAYLPINVTYSGKCHICPKMSYLSKNGIYAHKCHVCPKMTHLPINVTIAHKCHISPKMSHLPINVTYRLDGRKGSFFWGKGLCKGHEKRCKGHVQGPQIWQIELGARATWICARATRRGARASDVCKGHTNDKQYNLVQGPQLEVQGNLKF